MTSLGYQTDHGFDPLSAFQHGADAAVTAEPGTLAVVVWPKPHSRWQYQPVRPTAAIHRPTEWAVTGVDYRPSWPEVARLIVGPEQWRTAGLMSACRPLVDTPAGFDPFAGLDTAPDHRTPSEPAPGSVIVWASPGGTAFAAIRDVTTWTVTGTARPLRWPELLPRIGTPDRWRNAGVVCGYRPLTVSTGNGTAEATGGAQA